MWLVAQIQKGCPDESRRKQEKLQTKILQGTFGRALKLGMDHDCFFLWEYGLNTILIFSRASTFILVYS